MKSLDIHQSLLTFQWPALPLLLFNTDPFVTYKEILTVCSDRHRIKVSKWMSESNFMDRIPQLWFQGKKHPSTNRIKNELSLLLEFGTILTSGTHDASSVVYYFLVLFGYCCLVRSGVDVVELARKGLAPSQASSQRVPGGNDQASPFVPLNLALLVDQSDEEENELEPDGEEDVHVPPQAKSDHSDKTLSLNEVKAVLLGKPGPLFLPLDPVSPNKKKPVLLDELVDKLFCNKTVLQDSYAHQLRDIWVPALKLIKLYVNSKYCHPSCQTLSSKHGLLNHISKQWFAIVPFVSFWCCTFGCFAKSQYGLFPLEKDPLSLLNPASSPSSSWSSSSGSNASAISTVSYLSSNASNASQRSQLRKLLLESAAILEAKAGEGSPLSKSSMLAHPLFGKFLKASVIQATKLSKQDIAGKSSNYVAKFAAYSAIRLAHQSEALASDICQTITNKFTKEVGPHKVHASCLASKTPFFYAKTPKKLTLKDDYLIHVNSLAKEFDDQVEELI